MIAFIAIFALVATASASIIPAAPLVAAPLAAPVAAPIVTARSSQVIARNYNSWTAPLAVPAAFAAPAAYAASAVAPAPLAYSSPYIAAPFPYSAPAVAAPISPYFFRR